MKNIPKKIPVLFSRPQKMPVSFIDPKKSLLAKMSDPKKSFGPPLSLKYVSEAPGFVTHTAYRSWHQENQVANVPIKKISTCPLF